MAKVVDHDERRDSMAKVAALIIADEGLGHLTTRRLAKEMGCSLGIVSYYFETKADMVLAALGWSNRSIVTHLAKFSESEMHTIDQYKAMLQGFLPLTKQSDIEWRVRLNLITFSVTQRKLRAAHKERLNLAYDYTEGFLKQLKKQGIIRPELKIDIVAKNSVDLVFGLANYMIMIPMKERKARAEALSEYLDNLCV